MVCGGGIKWFLSGLGIYRGGLGRFGVVWGVSMDRRKDAGRFTPLNCLLLFHCSMTSAP